MSETKIHISRAIWDEDTHEVAYIVDGLMFADVATQRKLNAVDDMYEVLADMDDAFNDHLPESRLGILLTWVAFEKARVALRKARGEEE